MTKAKIIKFAHLAVSASLSKLEKDKSPKEKQRDHNLQTWSCPSNFARGKKMAQKKPQEILFCCHCDVVVASWFKNVVEKYQKIETWKATSVRSSPDYSLRRV